MGDRRSNFSQANIFFLVARLYQFAMYHSMLHRPSSTFLSLFSTTNLVRYYRRKPIHLAVKAPMLRDGKSIRINEVHRSLDHVQHLLEALWLKSPSGHNAIRVHNVMAASGRETHAINLAGNLHKVDSLASRTDSFQVAKSLTNPVHNATLLAERLDVRTTWDEDLNRT